MQKAMHYKRPHSWGQQQASDNRSAAVAVARNAVLNAGTIVCNIAGDISIGLFYCFIITSSLSAVLTVPQDYFVVIFVCLPFRVRSHTISFQSYCSFLFVTFSPCIG
jgi:hypothetical protein